MQGVPVELFIFPRLLIRRLYVLLIHVSLGENKQARTGIKEPYGSGGKKYGGDDTECLTSRYPIQPETVGYTLEGSALRCRYLGRLWCLWLVVVVFVVGVKATSVTDRFGVRK